jgi:MFS family permease
MTTVAAPAGRRAVVLTLAVLCVAQFMLIVVVVNVALPSIRETLDVSEARPQLVAVAYPLTFGSLLIVFGRAGDLFGRRNLFLTGVAVFTVASLANRPRRLGMAALRGARRPGRRSGDGLADRTPTTTPKVGKCEWTRH